MLGGDEDWGLVVHWDRESVRICLVGDAQKQRMLSVKDQSLWGEKES